MRTKMTKNLEYRFKQIFKFWSKNLEIGHEGWSTQDYKTPDLMLQGKCLIRTKPPTTVPLKVTLVNQIMLWVP